MKEYLLRLLILMYDRRENTLHSAVMLYLLLNVTITLKINSWEKKTTSTLQNKITTKLKKKLHKENKAPLDSDTCGVAPWGQRLQKARNNEVYRTVAPPPCSVPSMCAAFEVGSRYHGRIKGLICRVLRESPF